MVNITQIGEYSDIIDARSPAEYAEDHIPGAVNLPAFSNTERAAVGALYKTDPFAARRYGAALFTANIAKHLDSALARRTADWTPLVYCARGGQRSGGMVEVLRRIGWQAEQLCGGYKAYRQHVIRAIRTGARQYRWIVIAGETGVGKTCLLTALHDIGAQVVDLEKMANHRGSVFGAAAATAQPTQRKFETLLYTALSTLDKNAPVFIEAESRKIGSIHLPADLLAAMRAAATVRLQAEIALRVNYILDNYQDFCREQERFIETINKLKIFAGNARITAWQKQYQAGDRRALVRELLTDFYDIGYKKSLRTNYAAAYKTPPIEINPNDNAQVRRLAQDIQRRFCS